MGRFYWGFGGGVFFVAKIRMKRILFTDNE